MTRDPGMPIMDNELKRSIELARAKMQVALRPLIGRICRSECHGNFLV